jgi:hypothetical protein
MEAKTAVPVTPVESIIPRRCVSLTSCALCSSTSWSVRALIFVRSYSSRKPRVRSSYASFHRGPRSNWKANNAASISLSSPEKCRGGEEVDKQLVDASASS